MSWNGTVRCSFCGKKGHNRRSCPDLKKEIENNPTGYYARMQKLKKPASDRRCSYCNLKGHNRRTCPELKKDMNQWRFQAKHWRKKWAIWMAEIGLAPGALVKVQTGYSEYNVRLVKEVFWSSLNHERQKDYYPHQVFALAKLSSIDSYGGRMCLSKHEDLVPHGRDYVEVVGPVKLTADKILAMAPDWFVNAEDDLSNVFDKDRKSNDFAENQYK
jgi:hypothetical protein